MSIDYQRMMQEQLDGQLDAKQADQLWKHLQHDQQAAEEHAKLEAAHDFLMKIPPVRAPQRLAATIMARLAQSLQEEAAMQDLPEAIQQALMLGWSVVTVAMMPIVLAASYMVLNAMHSPKVLNRALERVIALMLMMIDALVIMLEEIEYLLKKDPAMVPVALSLIPVALLGMLEFVQGETEGPIAEVLH